MAGLRTILRPTSSFPPPPPSLYQSRLLLLLTAISFSMAAFAFVLQWHGELPDWISRLPPSHHELLGLEARRVPASSSSSGCADTLGQSHMPSFPYYRNLEFPLETGYGTDHITRECSFSFYLFWLSCVLVSKPFFWFLIHFFSFPLKGCFVFFLVMQLTFPCLFLPPIFLCEGYTFSFPMCSCTYISTYDVHLHNALMYVCSVCTWKYMHVGYPCQIKREFILLFFHRILVNDDMIRWRT